MELSILRNFFMLKNLLHIKMRDGNKTKRGGKKTRDGKPVPYDNTNWYRVGDDVLSVPLFFYIFLF